MEFDDVFLYQHFPSKVKVIAKSDEFNFLWLQETRYLQLLLLLLLYTVFVIYCTKTNTYFASYFLNLQNKIK